MKRCLMFVALIAASCCPPAPKATTTAQVTPPPPPVDAPLAPVAPPAPAIPLGLDLDGMDRNAKPGSDFYGYANGGWVKATTIPDDRARWGTFNIVADRTDKEIVDLIQAAAADANATAEAKQVGDYYATFMDEAAIEAKGLAPLAEKLKAIAAITDAKSLAHALGGSIRADVDPINNTQFHTANIFGLWIAQDLAAPTHYVPYLLQGGLSLPDRDYYLDADPHMAEIRTKFEAHVTTVLTLAKQKNPAATAKQIVALETLIAKTSGTRTESAQIESGTHHWSRADFAKHAPGLDWTAFFDAAGLGAQQDFVVWHPGSTTGIAAAVKNIPLATWKAYLTFHAIDGVAGLLPKAFVDEGFAFYDQTLDGTPQQRPRWKRGVAVTSAALGEAVGKLYVTQYFPPESKRRVEGMVKNILAAFATRIDKLTWMSPATKEKAKAKLATIKVAVGYPDRWRDYSQLQIVRGDAIGNADRASKYELARNLAKLGAPVDRDEWVMDPQLVNAVNLPAMNAMNYPAAILQAPFFDPNRADVVNYAMIGSVIGHEISHSFDASGATFDANGKFENWWTPDDLAHFKAAAAQLARQYDSYHPFPDITLPGELELDENIADVAGLAVAYDAYRAAYNGKEAETAEGFTGDQQFYLAFAQNWRALARDPALRKLVLTDGHAPGPFRALTVRNQDPWYAAFAVAPGDTLYLAPADRVHIW